MAAKIIAVLRNKQISYTYVEKEEDKILLKGKIIGEFATSHYLQNEKKIQDYLKGVYVDKKT